MGGCPSSPRKDTCSRGLRRLVTFAWCDHPAGGRDQVCTTLIPREETSTVSPLLQMENEGLGGSVSCPRLSTWRGAEPRFEPKQPAAGVPVCLH